MHLPVPAGLDFAWAVGFLSARAVPSLERVSAAEYRRSVRIDGAPVTLAIRPEPALDGAPTLAVRCSPPQRRRPIVDTVTRMFDLDAEVDGFIALAMRDALLAPLVARRPHIRLLQHVDPFEGLLRAILGQQVSLAAARTMTGRLVHLVGERAPALDGECLFCFPTAAAVAALSERDLLGMGLTRAKAAAISAAARAVAGGGLDLEALRERPGDEADAALRGVRGVGPWTASYVRMRVLGDRDAFPASDLGVVKALRALAGIERPSEIARLAERWRPWRAYATLHLWGSLAADRTDPPRAA